MKAKKFLNPELQIIHQTFSIRQFSVAFKVLLMVTLNMVSPIQLTGQHPLEKKVAQSICECITPHIEDFENGLSKCVKIAIEEFGEEYLQLLDSESVDTTEKLAYQKGEKWGHELVLRVFYDCDTLYEFINYQRYHQVDGIDKDSVRMLLNTLSYVKYSDWTLDFLTKRGSLYMVIEDYENAISDFEKALYLNKYSRLAQNFLGFCLEKQGKYEEAIAHFQKASSEKGMESFQIMVAFLQRKKAEEGR